MYLKSLEMVGFKSFAEAQIEFPNGVTAIVGPNGSGKSNVVDAILWVLGEQSTKTLRSERMEDVIFNGTELRKPLGMAEVSLVISGLDQVKVRGQNGSAEPIVGIPGTDDHPPALSQRRQRISDQQDPVPLEGHPQHLARYPGRNQGTHGHRARADRPDSQCLAAGSP